MFKALAVGRYAKSVLAASIVLFGASLLTAGGGSAPAYMDQGSSWTAARRTDFYSADQGSRLIKLDWLEALTQPDGQPFLVDHLARYGYLFNASSPSQLPVGFTVANGDGAQFVGMTCAACHTREINVSGQAYRIDGAPALADFQAFLADLDRAVGRVLSSDANFAPFAASVLEGQSTPAKVVVLKAEVATWYERQHALFARALPPQPWGIGRLDAVSMIFDRVSGLDVGTAPNGLIASNIYAADAPVRYPFIWDAPRQDKTQWPGFAENGDALFALVRNLGEVYGVFADFHPIKDGSILGYDYHSHNSANFDGLNHLESLVRDIGPPKWPWPVDATMASRGAPLFAQNCGGCHAIRQGAVRFLPLSGTWHTPVVDVGTDTREYDVLGRTAQSGVLQGAFRPGGNLQATDRQFNILAAAVIGSTTDRIAHHGLPAEALIQPLGAAWLRSFGAPLQSPQQELAMAYHEDAAEKAAANVAHPYEARVLQGIWATAPYLHDGSVATLTDLLKPASARAPSFALGKAYDVQAVGLAVDQGPAAPRRLTTGCEDRHSGNSRCGHEYGTTLTDGEKRDLLEYLKTL